MKIGDVLKLAPCPSGYARVDDDETGVCHANTIRCEGSNAIVLRQEDSAIDEPDFPPTEPVTELIMRHKEARLKVKNQLMTKNQMAITTGQIQIQTTVTMEGMTIMTAMRKTIATMKKRIITKMTKKVIS